MSKSCKIKKILIILISIALVAAILLAFFAVCYRSFKSVSVYNNVDNGKSVFYSGKKVLVVVPHQDDDLSVMGGVFEEFLRYGSQVKVLFVTAGDFSAHPGVRMGEAIDTLTLVGIPEEDIIFLGYPDTGLFAPIKNIYNYPEDEIVDYFGQINSTYALDSHPAYNDGNTYTRRHLCEDLYSAIAEYMPDILICNDYDEHPDHRATSLFFDEVTGTILKDYPDYEPTILKTFAYSYTFYGYDDFYDSINLISTKKTCDTPYLTETNIFNWDDRIRIPVCADTLSRCIDTSKLYKEASLYYSQNAQANSGRVINSDRVFFQRESGSLVLDATISVSSGNPMILNDFKLIDSNDVTVKDELPTAGTWIPDNSDNDKCITVTFNQPTDISRICLYDNPSLDDNITDAVITFDDGDEISTGPLAANGCATEIQLSKNNVLSFSVKIISSVGNSAGLTEIEAYDKEKSPITSLIKLMNDNGDFVYDYYIDTTECFSLYTIGLSDSFDDYDISCSSVKCSFVIENNLLRITCPRGEACIITVSSKDSLYSDSVYISNPGFAVRTGWMFEAWAYRHNYPWRNNFIYNAIKKNR